MNVGSQSPDLYCTLGMSDVKIDRHGHKIVENGSNNPEHLYTSATVEELTQKLNLLAM